MRSILFPFTLLFNAIFFPPNGRVRVVTWSVSLLVVLFISSAISWQLGKTRYYYQGQPNDYASNMRMRGNYQLLNALSNNRQNGNLTEVSYFLEQPVGLFSEPPNGHLWKLQEDGTYALSDTEVRLSLDSSPDGKITGYRFNTTGFEEYLASRLMLQLRSKWNAPKLIEAPWEYDPQVGERVAWWTNDFLLDVHWTRVQLVPYREKELEFQFETLAKTHPDFPARKAELEAALKAQTP